MTPSLLKQAVLISSVSLSFVLKHWPSCPATFLLLFSIRVTSAFSKSLSESRRLPTGLFLSSEPVLKQTPLPPSMPSSAPNSPASLRQNAETSSASMKMMDMSLPSCVAVRSKRNFVSPSFNRVSLPSENSSAPEPVILYVAWNVLWANFLPIAFTSESPPLLLPLFVASAVLPDALVLPDAGVESPEGFSAAAVGVLSVFLLLPPHAATASEPAISTAASANHRILGMSDTPPTQT